MPVFVWPKMKRSAWGDSASLHVCVFCFTLCVFVIADERSYEEGEEESNSSVRSADAEERNRVDHRIAPPII